MDKNNDKIEYNFSAIRLLLTGFTMGFADLIPGVSGGTIAFIMGIYAHLLEAIKSFNVKFIKLLCSFKIKEAISIIPLKFLIPLGAGIGIAILSMSNLMSYLLENQRVYLFSFFFGLVLASILTISIKLKWGIGSIISLIGGSIAAYWVVGLIPMEMPHDPITLFLSGVVAIMAMILPGISGSFILLILGQYEHVLNAVKTYDVFTVLPVALGAVIGITSFSRVLSWILKKYYTLTVTFLVGFMVGSLRKIWPWKEIVLKENTEIEIENNILPVFSSNEFYFAIGLVIVGFVLLVVLDKVQSKYENQ